MHKEIDFENDIEQALTSGGGYEAGDPSGYDPEVALFPGDVIAFVQKTQPKFWTRLTQLDAVKAPSMLLDSLTKELAAKGSLAILREGFKCVGTPADQLFFDQIRETAAANEQLRQAIMANSIENFEPVFNKQLENLFIERMDGNEDIFVRLMNDEAFRNVASGHLVRAVYEQVRGSVQVDSV